MADGRVETAGVTDTTRSLWSEITRIFPVALDPRKLLLAAAGIFVMSLGWYVLSAVFAGKAPDPGAAEYQPAAMQKSLGDTKPDGKPYTSADYAKLGREAYDQDFKQWVKLNDLAGEGGKLRTLPWNENRGDNPFLIASDATGAGTSLSTKFLNYLADQVPVVTEPLAKLFLLVFKLIDPTVTFLTRVYVLLCLLWSVAVWAYFGGIITRIAAVQFGGKERVTLRQAMKFVTARYTAYVLSPLVPLIIVGFIVLGMSLYGLVALIPVIGDVFLYGLGLPLVILGGVVMAILLIGLLGYPLMYSTLSTEGSDTFDAVSRSYNYVFQAPWAYIRNWVAAVLYGAAVTFVVILIGCMMVYLGKWAVSVPASVLAPSRKPDFLFVYAPESLGWKELLLKGSPAAIEWKSAPVGEDGKVENPTGASMRVRNGETQLLLPANPEASQAYRDDLRIHNKIGAGMAAFWMGLIFLMMIGFTYSFFWSAAAMIYLLMRKKVDEVDTEEVYVEDDTPPVGPAPVPPAPVSPPPAPGLSLPMSPPPPPVSPPVSPPPPPPVSPPPVSYTPVPEPKLPPPAPESHSPEDEDPRAEDPKKDDDWPKTP